MYIVFFIDIIQKKIVYALMHDVTKETLERRLKQAQHNIIQNSSTTRRFFGVSFFYC